MKKRNCKKLAIVFTGGTITMKASAANSSSGGKPVFD